jgi:mannose-6-phosphate isomerase-like protein (cupin superfamily)
LGILQDHRHCAAQLVDPFREDDPVLGQQPAQAIGKGRRASSMRMSRYFYRLEDALRGLATDPATAADKRSSLFDGQHISCNVNILEESGDVIHIQSDHDEAAQVLEGRCGFRVGEETRRVEPGDLIFIPRDTVHGPIIDRGRVALLSIFAPFFDRTKKNIRWSRDAFA